MHCLKVPIEYPRISTPQSPPNVYKSSLLPAVFPKTDLKVVSRLEKWEQ